jgi:hypothetical protein
MFQIIAVALAIAAALFVWRSDLDIAFVIGVLAVCSFFLSIRFAFKPRVSERDIERRDNDPDDAKDGVKTTE